MYELNIYDGNGNWNYSSFSASVNALKIECTKKVFNSEIDYHAGNIVATIENEKGELLFSTIYEYRTGKHEWKKEI